LEGEIRQNCCSGNPDQTACETVGLFFVLFVHPVPRRAVRFYGDSQKNVTGNEHERENRPTFSHAAIVLLCSATQLDRILRAAILLHKLLQLSPFLCLCQPIVATVVLRNFFDYCHSFAFFFTFYLFPDVSSPRTVFYQITK
jgi:hypothetical protein